MLVEGGPQRRDTDDVEQHQAESLQYRVVDRVDVEGGHPMPEPFRHRPGMFHPGSALSTSFDRHSPRYAFRTRLSSDSSRPVPSSTVEPLSST